MIRKACIALSMQLHTGLDYVQALSLEELNDIANDVNELAQEVKRYGEK